MLCGRAYVPDACDIGDHDDDLFTPPEKRKKPVAICELCQAKLKHEADKGQKPPKPV
jgi:hypothetical protein